VWLVGVARLCPGLRSSISFEYNSLCTTAVLFECLLLVDPSVYFHIRAQIARSLHSHCNIERRQFRSIVLCVTRCDTLVDRFIQFHHHYSRCIGLLWCFTTSNQVSKRDVVMEIGQRNLSGTLFYGYSSADRKRKHWANRCVFHRSMVKCTPPQLILHASTVIQQHLNVCPSIGWRPSRWLPTWSFATFYSYPFSSPRSITRTFEFPNRPIRYGNTIDIISCWNTKLNQCYHLHLSSSRTCFFSSKWFVGNVAAKNSKLTTDWVRKRCSFEWNGSIVRFRIILEWEGGDWSSWFRGTADWRILCRKRSREEMHYDDTNRVNIWLVSKYMNIDIVYA
jgi:hypothetical protein